MRLCSGAFANLSGEADREYFADGIVEDITTALSRMRWLVVIARNSSFTFKGRAADAKQVGRELGVRHLLQGSVRTCGEPVRAGGQLINASPGTHAAPEPDDQTALGIAAASYGLDRRLHNLT